jgi:hypothetical protein
MILNRPAPDLAADVMKPARRLWALNCSASSPMRLGVLLDDFRDRPGAQRLGKHVAMAIDGPEQRTLGDRCRLEPRHHGIDRLEPRACQDGDDLALAFLVGLGAADRDPQPGLVGSRSATVSAASSERRNAPAKPSSRSARSRVPLSVSGQQAIMSAMMPCVAGALRVWAAPFVRRMPFMVALTASEPVGSGSMPLSAWA